MLDRASTARRSPPRAAARRPTDPAGVRALPRRGLPDRQSPPRGATIPRRGLLALAVLLSSMPAASPAQVTPESDVKAEVRAAWDAYIEAFSAGRTAVLADDVYAAPSFQLGAAGAVVRSRADDTRAAFDAVHERLAIENYDRSETDRAAICVVNPATALLSAHFTRYRTDGSVLGRGASSYLFARLDGRWRILAMMANPAGKLIACD